MITRNGTGRNDGCDGRQASAEPDEGGLGLKGAALPLVGGSLVVLGTDYGSYVGTSADECGYTWEELIFFTHFAFAYHTLHILTYLHMTWVQNSFMKEKCII